MMNLKNILVVEEQAFREAGKYGDTLMSILRDREQDIKDNCLYIRTNLRFEHHSLEIAAFNEYLRMLRRQQVVGVQIRLD